MQMIQDSKSLVRPESGETVSQFIARTNYSGVHSVFDLMDSGMIQEERDTLKLDVMRRTDSIGERARHLATSLIEGEDKLLAMS